MQEDDYEDKIDNGQKLEQTEIFVIREKIEKNRPLRTLFNAFSSVRHDAAPRRVPTTRQAGERRRQIIDVHIIASLNRVTNLSTTPGNMLFGPLSSLAAHHHRFMAFYFSNVSPRCRRLPPRQAPNRFREYPEYSHTTSRAQMPSTHPIISSLARQARLLRGDAREIAQSACSPRGRSRLGR